MIKPRLRLPSPAVVIAMVALLLVLGGTAVAAGTSLHDDARADRALVKKLAPRLTVKHAMTADNATTANNATLLGDAPPSSYEAKNAIMWAVVTNDGTKATVTRGSGGITATRKHIGSVYVAFPRDVRGCAWIATQGEAGNSSVFPSATAAVRGNGIPSNVWVITYDTTSATATHVDAGFHILVTC